MSWGRIDDGLHDHEKFMGFGPAVTPRELWMIGLSWTHRNYRRFTVPGFVPADMPMVWAGARRKGERFAAELAGRRLWEPVDGGWIFHDWLDYASPEERAHFGAESNRQVGPKSDDASADVRDLSEKRREAGRRGAAVTNGKRRDGRQTSANDGRQTVGKSASAESANGRQVGKPEPVADTFADPLGRQTVGKPEPEKLPAAAAAADLPIRQEPARAADDGRADSVRSVLAALKVPASWADDVSAALDAGHSPDAITSEVLAPVSGTGRNETGIRRGRLRELKTKPVRAQPLPPPARRCDDHAVTYPSDQTCPYCDAADDERRRQAAEQAEAHRQAEEEQRRNLDDAIERLGPAICLALAKARQPPALKDKPPTGTYLRMLVDQALDEHGWDLDAARAEAESRKEA